MPARHVLQALDSKCITQLWGAPKLPVPAWSGSGEFTVHDEHVALAIRVLRQECDLYRSRALQSLPKLSEALWSTRSS
eukprot:15433885-Alexandrium_andersonii.AAC.1